MVLLLWSSLVCGPCEVGTLCCCGSFIFLTDSERQHSRKLLNSHCKDSFYSARNARIASAVLATAIPSVRPSTCLSVTRRYCVKTTARSTVQFSPLDSKMCLVLYKPQNIPQGRPLPLKFWLKVTYPPEGCEFWHVLSCSASTVRDRKRSSITLNKNSTRAFQRAINQGSTPPLTSSKWG